MLESRDMKKFLAAIIISLLWSGNAYSELYDFKIATRQKLLLLMKPVK